MEEKWVILVQIYGVLCKHVHSPHEGGLVFSKDLFFHYDGKVIGWTEGQDFGEAILWFARNYPGGLADLFVDGKITDYQPLQTDERPCVNCGTSPVLYDEPVTDEEVGTWHCNHCGFEWNDTDEREWSTPGLDADKPEYFRNHTLS